METQGQSGGSYETEAMRERASATLERASSTAHQTVDRLASRAQQAKERLVESSEQWMSQGQHYIEQTREMVRANPLAAVGIAVAAGILLSKLTSRR
ncbi:MAG: DUF883 family protein [Burkholderiales bacterium]|nr:DUF883 family protein [Burkholderiales bacterium]PZM99892.1 MAG: DUF883 domain-containing protein [Pseudomonadota bacterium]